MIDLSNPMSDPLVQRLSYDLNEAKEIIKDMKMTNDELRIQNKELSEKYERLLKDNMEMSDRYLSIIDKIKRIGGE